MMPTTERDPYEIRLWLATKLSDGRSDTLYTKTIRTAHPPIEGDQIYLWPETDEVSAPLWLVKRRYWNADGQLNVEMCALIHNPTADSIEEIRRQATYRLYPWYSEPGEPGPDAHLLAAGWTEWDGTL